MMQEVRAEIARILNGGRITHLATETRTTGFRLLLLPVWWARYSFAGQPQVVLVNGQSGTASGQTPTGPWRTTLLAAAIILFPVLVIYLLSLR
jgi:hypothetical protein